MIFLDDIRPLSDFVRNAKAHIARLAKRGQPEILTVNGKAEVVVLSAQTFEKMYTELETATLQNTVNQTLLEMFRSDKLTAKQLRAELKPNPAGQSIPLKDAFAELRRSTNARRKKKAS